MQVLCKAGDKFRIGNDVTLEILSLTETAAEVEVVTSEGSYVEIIEAQKPEEQVPTCLPQEERVLTGIGSYNRLSGYLSMN